MWRFLLFIALGGAAAESAEASLIRLDYSGTIYSAGAGYSVGDQVSGFLLLNTALAPPNDSPWQPDIGTYDGRSSSPQFVTSGREPPASSTTSLSDVVSITSAPGTVFPWSERIAIRDGEYYGGSREEILVDLKFASIVDVLFGNSIEQNYEGLNGQPLGNFSVPGGIGTSFIQLSDFEFDIREAIASVDSFRFTDVSAVPAPPALWLFLSGLMGLYVSRRKSATTER